MRRMASAGAAFSRRGERVRDGPPTQRQSNTQNGDNAYEIGPSSTDANMSLYAPSKGWFIASLIIAVIAVLSALSPIPYISTYGIWVAILAYIVLAIGNLAQT